MTEIRAVPCAYKGAWFRSTLEADWAKTFDSLGISWSYEPIALDLGGGIRYLCDFYLPAQRVWFEVKGPHDQRLEKTYQLHKALDCDLWDWKQPLVIVGRIPQRGFAAWHGITKAQQIIIRECGRCSHNSFLDYNGPWQCRVCGHREKHGQMEYESGNSLIFYKVDKS